jgi:hypothetical protein
MTKHRRGKQSRRPCPPLCRAAAQHRSADRHSIRHSDILVSRNSARHLRVRRRNARHHLGRLRNPHPGRGAPARPIGADREGGHPRRRTAVLIRISAEDGAFGPVLFLRFQNQITTPAPAAPTSGCSATSANNYGYIAALTNDALQVIMLLNRRIDVATPHLRRTVHVPSGWRGLETRNK